jgi:hypothetical protein
MYQLLLKQRFKFAVRMIKRNIGAYLILIAIVPCILILQSMIQTTHGMDIAVFIPYGILCFLFMNLFGTIPRMRISPETYIWKIEKTYIWRVKKIGKSTVLTLCVALILFWAFPMEGIVLRQFIVVMICNPIVNMHTVLSTQYKYRDITNICMLAVVMICFFNRSVFVASVLLIIYGLYFILYPYFSYQAIIPFFQQYNQMLYGFLNREYDTVLQTQDEVFFQNNQREMKGLMKKYYGNRYRFLMVYEVVSVIRRKKQIMYQYFAIVLITMLLSQIEGKYIEYVLLFSILILGQNVVSYNVQNELRLVRKGFPLRYSLKEKLQCKSVIGMFLLLLPMLCYWIAYKIELFSIILWIWIPIQSIIIYTAKNRLQRLLYILPFYILSLLSMRVW